MPEIDCTARLLKDGAVPAKHEVVWLFWTAPIVNL